ncbi:MAG: RHS repeat-associated core domain-containing protein [Armatimonadota bacterium]
MHGDPTDAGNLTLYTYPEGFQIGYVYDNAGRLQKIDYPTGVDTTFSYDDVSRLTQMVDSTGTTTWGYNNADQVTSLAQPAGTITYDYDDNARLWKMHQPGSLTTTYTYDFAWRLKTITNGFGEQTSFDYDDASRVIKKTFANGTYETYSYDPRSRVEWIKLFNSSNALLSSHHYTYDPASNVETRTDNGTTTTFGYDDIGQLISESRAGYSATYSYDKNGNRLTRTLDTGSGPTTEVYAYDDADKLLNVKVNGNVVKSFSYDLAGRTTGITDAGGTTSLAYDYEDRVTSISRPGMTTNTFAYNGFGARVSKSDSGGSTTYLRSGTSVVAPVVSVSGAESATFTPGISERRGTESRFYHGDIKNFVEQTDSSGTIVSSQQYDAFGNLVSSGGGTWNGPFAYGGRFGYQSDGDYDLKLLGHRYYDSATGRFLSRDPIKDGRNWYAYVANNPVRFADPSGLRRTLWEWLEDQWEGFKEFLGFGGSEVGMEVAVLPEDVSVSVPSVAVLLQPAVVIDDLQDGLERYDYFWELRSTPDPTWMYLRPDDPREHSPSPGFGRPPWPTDPRPVGPVREDDPDAWVWLSTRTTEVPAGD